MEGWAREKCHKLILNNKRIVYQPSVLLPKLFTSSIKYLFKSVPKSYPLPPKKSSRTLIFQYLRGFYFSLELGVFLVSLNFICLSFVQIHACFYCNYIIYYGLLIFCCQNVFIYFNKLLFEYV